MAVTLMCPNLKCRKVLMVPDKTRGKRVRCAYCGTLLIVPWATGFDKKPFSVDAVALKKAKNKEEG